MNISSSFENLCFVGIKGKYFQGQHQKHLIRFCTFLWLCALKYIEGKNEPMKTLWPPAL